MVEYDQSHWHKVTEKPYKYARIVVIYIPDREYANAICGRYIPDTCEVWTELYHRVKLSDILSRRK